MADIIPSSVAGISAHAALTMDTHGLASFVDATLSGTPKVIQVTIGGVPYYIKAYPTKV